MKKRNFLSCLLIIAIVLATISPTVLFAAEDIAQDEQVYDETYTEETEEYVEETPEAYDWTIETNELKKWPQGPQVEAEGATVMDLDTGAFLYSKNAEAKLYPASITKIMTMLVALEHISDSDLDTKVKASESALAPIDSDSSQIWLSVGEKITVRSALYAIMLASANDAANVIAEYVGGSMDNFVKMMNDKAKELGCVNTHFVNPHGLHNKKHYTCAHDMALIAQAAFQIPLFRKITKTVEYKIPKTKYMKEDRWLVNHQKMLYEDGEFTYKNCEGGKTGFTDEAWNTLVTYAKKDGKTLVCVELRVNGSWKTFNESAELLDYGFDKFRHEEGDAALDTTTLGQLAGICHFGTASVLDQKEAGIRAVEGKSTVSVTIPKKLKTDKLKRGFCDGNKIVYSYQGWEVGEETLKFNNPAFEVTKTEISDATLQGQTDTNGSETETAGSTEAPEKDASGSKGFEEKVDEFMDNITFGFLNIWTSCNGWVDQHEMLSATVGMLLILLMIPLIVIAYMRDKNDKLARKEREQDKEQQRSWYDFLMDALIDGGVMKRIDLAINDHTGILDIPELAEKCRKREYIGKSRSYKFYQSGELIKHREDDREYMGRTLYLGSLKSDVYFCIYEKDYEQYVKLGTPLEEADIINRFEIRLRNERAYYAVRDLLTYYDAEQTAFSIINQYVRFVDEEPDKRKNDWKLNDRWAWFIGDNRQSLKLTTKPEPYTLDRTLRWVQRQVAPTLKMLKKIDKGNGTDYMETIEQQAKLTEKHEMIIKQQTTPAKDLVES